MAGCATLRAMEARLTYRGRAVTDDDVTFVRQLIAAHPTASRRALSRKLCEAWNWVQPNGALRDMVCRGLMLALHRAGHIELPAPRYKLSTPWVRHGGEAPTDIDRAPVRGPLNTVQPLEFRQVRRTDAEPDGGKGKTSAANAPATETSRAAPHAESPASTATNRPAGGKDAPPKPIEVVFVTDGDRVQMAPVKRGISDDNYLEITEGLTEGQEVVSGGYKAINRELEDGKKIKRGTPEKEKEPEKKT